MPEYPPLEVKVWGDFACFTRPEMKVERVSYPVMTPSAARGILEAIFWKPEIRLEVREIWVLKPIQHFSIVRNEVNHKAAVSAAMGWAEKGGGYFADDERNRAQRHTLALRDVAYIIHADVVLQPHATEDVAKYRDQFRRRVAQGKCHHTPYLGCREFPGFFCEPDGTERPIDLSDDLGRILFDLSYLKDGSGRGTPIFEKFYLEKGIVSVPEGLYMKEVSHASSTT